MNEIIIKTLHNTVAKLNRYKHEAMVKIISSKSSWESEKSYFLKQAGSPGFFRPPNIGDALSSYIYERLSAHKAPPALGMVNPAGLPNYMTVGSILQFADEHTIVWGSGFNTERSIFGCKNWKEADEAIIRTTVKPRKICAVRGPLTRKRVMKLGVECPNVLGDPGLLMPLLYRPLNQEKKNFLGIIPHFSHLNSRCFENLLLGNKVKIISVYQHPERFIDELVRCEFIISSSLHGLILADAYNIPSLWIRPSEHLHNTKFKYLDYLESIESEPKEVTVINSQTTVRDIMPRIQITKNKKINLVPLIEACPFIDKDKLTNLLLQYQP